MNVTETVEAKQPGRLWMVVGVIALVVVVLAAAGWMWHEKPTFCNAVCHQPMDRYVQGYYGGDTAVLIAAHADEDIACLDCHEPKASQQLGEAGKWAIGDFSDPLQSREFATRGFCTRSGCHDYSEVSAATENWGGQEGVNPHDSHQGEIDCFNCHSMHGTSTLACNSCHSWTLPDGWENGSAGS